ncbi:cyclic AMP-responsive element-binding protein 3-like protein 4 [Antennarius striatus]|uniref:cyclic AMP-responsive element-binding protein 3-like protein 4 n=1 Tax=Antennarius striatus TaxID=241820 RepID=UPI0035AFE45C
MDAESGELFVGGVAADGFHLDNAQLGCFSSLEEPLPDWAVDPDCALNDSEPEDVLHAVDPNAVFPSGPPVDQSSESDSGISEDPVVESPIASVTPQLPPATVYQVVYDLSSLGRMKPRPAAENVISIELDEWSSQVLFSDSCIVNELSVVPAAHMDGAPTATDPPSPGSDLLYPELQLTDEEQKLLSQEGVSLPSNLPLTKAEERILKRVRRKIRNKQSAQDSRRRRKEYIDGLESRAAAFSAQNKELQRTVEQLEKRNMSLLTQLHRLQSLIRQTASKGAQTSTCLLVILVSLALIILPSFSPFRRSQSDDDHRPTGVLSRNILTDVSSPQMVSNGGEGLAVQSDASSPPSEEPIQELPTINWEGRGQEGSQSGNLSAPVTGPRAEPEAGIDSAKPAHADEM